MTKQVVNSLQLGTLVYRVDTTRCSSIYIDDKYNLLIGANHAYEKDSEEKYTYIIFSIPLPIGKWRLQKNVFDQEVRITNYE